MTDSPKVPEFQEVNLNILVNNEAFAGIFDELEVWRATSPGQPYIELTGPGWLPARLPANAGPVPEVLVAGPQVNVINKQLSLLARSGMLAQYDFNFIGSSAALLKDVAIQITQQSLGNLHAYVDDDAKLVIETVGVGAGAYLQVLPGDAAVFLGLPIELPDSEAYGREGRIRLASGVGSYTFLDRADAPTATYRTRFRNSLTGATSEFSVPFNGKQSIGVSASNLVVGFLQLVGSNGRPQADIEVTISSTFRGALVEGKLLAGADLVDSTNSDGYVEFELVRGQPYTIGIAGTNIVKDFTAPVDSSIATFSLVDPAYSTSDSNDYFRARVPDLPTLERRSI